MHPPLSDPILLHCPITFQFRRCLFKIFCYHTKNHCSLPGIFIPRPRWPSWVHTRTHTHTHTIYFCMRFSECPQCSICNNRSIVLARMECGQHCVVKCEIESHLVDITILNRNMTPNVFSSLPWIYISSTVCRQHVSNCWKSPLTSDIILYHLHVLSYHSCFIWAIIHRMCGQYRKIRMLKNDEEFCLRNLKFKCFSECLLIGYGKKR